MRKTVVASLLMLLCLVLYAPAAAADGLGAYKDVKTYRSGMFTDVPTGSWCEGGVRAVYAKGIMQGTSANRFSPNQTVTWAQAVAIAARLHAAYTGNQLPAPSARWYASYLSYVKQAGLLPSTCPEDAQIASRAITRQELAGLFSGVLPDAEIPAVNDHSAGVPDSQAAALEFRGAIQKMYAAGVFTGKSSGAFDPAGSATRGEIAVITARLLLPGQRISWDRNANQASLNQLGNFNNGGLAVMSGDTTYYVYHAQTGQKTYVNSIVARKNDGSLKTVYSASENIEYLSMGDDGLLYFSTQKALCRLNPADGKAETIYNGNGTISAYLLYNHEIYFTEEYVGGKYTDNWRYHICKLNAQGQPQVLMDGITFSQSCSDWLYGFGGKLYFLYGDKTYESDGHTYSIEALWSVDLNTGASAKVIDKVYLNEMAFHGATAWMLEKPDSDNLPLRIVRFNLALPQDREIAATLPQAASQLFPNLYANGPDLYFQSSGGKRVWHISAAGTVTEAAQTKSTSIEHSTVVKQATLLHAMPWVKVLDNEQIDVLLPDGKTISYAQFLGNPYHIAGGERLPATANRLSSKPDPTPAGTVSDQHTACYYTSQGDLVEEVTIGNGLQQDITVDNISAITSAGGQTIVWCFQGLGVVKAGKSTVVSLVFPAHTIGKEYSVKDVKFETTLQYFLNNK